MVVTHNKDIVSLNMAVAQLLKDAYAAGLADGKQQTYKEVGEWLGKCHTYEDPKYRGRCELCDGIEALLDGIEP